MLSSCMNISATQIAVYHRGAADSKVDSNKSVRDGDYIRDDWFKDGMSEEDKEDDKEDMQDL